MRLKPTSTCDRQDFFSAALLGLLTAIRRFDVARGCKLSSLAVPYMRGAIRDEYRRSRSLVNTKRSERETPTDSLDQLVSDGGGMRIHDLLVGSDASVDLGSLMRVAFLHERVGRLSKQERAALWCYWWRDMNQPEIAAWMGVSESRVSQIMLRGINRLRGWFGVEIPPVVRRRRGVTLRRGERERRRGPVAWGPGEPLSGPLVTEP